MPLPAPDQISWREWSYNFKITVPTFELTPIEKPDMSPFLIHMTGKNAILSILRGENCPEPIPHGHGFLQASVPEYNQGIFDARVVSFTESPTFAIDFFRYRSFRRWEQDLRFGIGFDKPWLIREGVRPVLYADEELIRGFNSLHQHIVENGGLTSLDDFLAERVVEMIVKTYPLLFPLLENERAQGFMWEREWRYPKPEGFMFDQHSIRIICCPENEEYGIREILGPTADNIDFIRTWQEYDDITNYLRRQQPIWEAKSKQYETAKETEDATSKLKFLIRSYRAALASLDAYDEFIAHLHTEADRIAQERTALSETIKSLEAELRMLEEEEESKDSDDKDPFPPF